MNSLVDYYHAHKLLDHPEREVLFKRRLTHVQKAYTTEVTAFLICLNRHGLHKKPTEVKKLLLLLLKEQKSMHIALEGILDVQRYAVCSLSLFMLLPQKPSSLTVRSSVFLLSPWRRFPTKVKEIDK